MSENEKFEFVTDVVAGVADYAVCYAIKRSDMSWPLKILVAIPWALQGSVNLCTAVNRFFDKPVSEQPKEES